MRAWIALFVVTVAAAPAPAHAQRAIGIRRHRLARVLQHRPAPLGAQPQARALQPVPPLVQRHHREHGNRERTLTPPGVRYGNDGGFGNGKTHLLNAIALEARTTREARVA